MPYVKIFPTKLFVNFSILQQKLYSRYDNKQKLSRIKLQLSWHFSPTLKYWIELCLEKINDTHNKMRRASLLPCFSLLFQYFLSSFISYLFSLFKTKSKTCSIKKGKWHVHVSVQLCWSTVLFMETKRQNIAAGGPFNTSHKIENKQSK